MKDPVVETSHVHHLIWHLIGKDTPKGCCGTLSFVDFLLSTESRVKKKDDAIAVGETGQVSGSDMHHDAVASVV